MKGKKLLRRLIRGLRPRRVETRVEEGDGRPYRQMRAREFRGQALVLTQQEVGLLDLFPFNRNTTTDLLCLLIISYFSSVTESSEACFILKRPLSSYMEFCKVERPKVHLSCPTLKAREVIKELGRRWSEISPTEKALYQEVAAKSMKVFKDQKQSDNNTRRKHVEEIKKPVSSYMHFAAAERSNIASISFTEVGQELGRRWRHLNMEQRAEYELLAREDFQRYEIQLERRRAEERVEQEQELVEGREGGRGEEGEPSMSVQPVQGYTISDLGFAKHKGYPYYPAVRTGTIGGGSRSLVTYFGTGQTSTVDSNKFIKYSLEAEVKFSTEGQLRSAAYIRGMEQLKGHMLKLCQDPSGDHSIAIDFATTGSARRMSKLCSVGLQQDEEEVDRLEKAKILRVIEGVFKFRCKDCPWRGRYLHTARAHVRECGQRHRVHIRKPQPDQYPCSGTGVNIQERALLSYRSSVLRQLNVSAQAWSKLHLGQDGDDGHHELPHSRVNHRPLPLGLHLHLVLAPVVGLAEGSVGADRLQSLNSPMWFMSRKS